MDWWNSLSGYEQALAGIGIFAFLAFVIQTAISVVGGIEAELETDLETGADGDHGGMSELFSVRNLLSFLTGFSWFSLGFLQLGVWPVVALLLGVAAGSFFAWLNVLMLAAVSMLTSEGNIEIGQAVGQVGRISLGISEGAASLGKVALMIGERQVELLARSRDGSGIARNSAVRIVELQGDTAVVAPETAA